MNIGIIGTGQVGGTLARKLVALGHQVFIANSRGAASLQELAAQIGAKAVNVSEAVRHVELIILAIPTKSVTELPKRLFADVPHHVVVVDTGNYHPELRDGRIDEIEQGLLDSQWVEKQISRSVVKSFNNILASSLESKSFENGHTHRIALSVAGDSSKAKKVVLDLISQLGFDAIDGGKLEESWRQQTGAPTYCKDLNASELQKALSEAKHENIKKYRASREDEIRKLLES